MVPGVALFVAAMTSIGGPLAELPFVAHDFWQYLPQPVIAFP